jgi:hypothetical protein
VGEDLDKSWIPNHCRRLHTHFLLALPLFGGTHPTRYVFIGAFDFLLGILYVPGFNNFDFMPGSCVFMCQ